MGEEMTMTGTAVPRLTMNQNNHIGNENGRYIKCLPVHQTPRFLTCHNSFNPEIISEGWAVILIYSGEI